MNQCQNQKNTIDPQEIINNYGADAVRLFILSDSPPEKMFNGQRKELFRLTNLFKNFGHYTLKLRSKLMKIIIKMKKIN